MGFTCTQETLISKKFLKTRKTEKVKVISQMKNQRNLHDTGGVRTHQKENLRFIALSRERKKKSPLRRRTTTREPLPRALLKEKRLSVLPLVEEKDSGPSEDIFGKTHKHLPSRGKKTLPGGKLQLSLQIAPHSHAPTHTSTYTSKPSVLFVPHPSGCLLLFLLCHPRAPECPSANVE